MSELRNATAKIIRRSRGEAIDIATAAGLVARVCVLSIEEERVSLVLVAAPEVRFEELTREQAEHRARRASSLDRRQEAIHGRGRRRA